MVDQNVIDRELGLEVMRRGLVTREALMPYLQRHRSDPSTSFAGLLIAGGVITRDLAPELERVARARAEAAGGAAPDAPAVPQPPKTPPGTKRDPGTSSAVRRASSQRVQVPGATFMDLSAEEPQKKKPAPRTPPPTTQPQATFLDVDMEVPDPARTSLEEETEPPEEKAPVPAAAALPDAPTDIVAGARDAHDTPTGGTARPTEVGKSFGDYEVLAALGEGAMGTVFRAKHRPSGQVVALKVMRGGLVANAKVRDRFLREAKAAKLIDHVNVVRFLDAGMVGNDQFLAMEFVEGRSLQSLLAEKRGKPLPLKRAFEIFRQLAGGLQAAHAAGVIHRDLKPDNVLLTKDGEVAKITDFGLARREEESMLLTRPGQIMGSPYYMAPEQGQGLPVDARADIYSLGAILFCMVTGSVPFPFPSATEVIHAHCQAERPDPRDLNPEVTPDLAMLILKMLAVEAEARPQTAQQALDDFDEALDAPSPPAKPVHARAEDTDEDVGHEVFKTANVVDAYPEGTRIGKLTIEGVIGAGGMGAVYRARHDDGRISALKVLPKKLAGDQKRVESFLREAELGSQVNHRNVVETRDYGRDEALGVAYIELELVQGTSLEHLIKTGVLQDESLLINVTRGIGQALHALHSAGILHRDVKPANVLLAGEFLSQPDANVKLIDMGLAIAKASAPRTTTKLSPVLLDAALEAPPDGMPPPEEAKEGEPEKKVELAGTALYMSPEASEGGVVDERSDIYSLGATIYHVATGHPPFEGSTVAAIAYQHRRAQAKPPRERNPGLTAGFSAIIELLLRKEKEERYQSAMALVTDLSKATAEGKLATPVIHAKYRTNRIYSGDVKLRVEMQAAKPPPPKSHFVAAIVIAVVCGVVFLIQGTRWVIGNLTSNRPSSNAPTGGGTTGGGPQTSTVGPATSDSDPDAAIRAMAQREAQKRRDETIAKINEKMYPVARNPNYLEARALYDALLKDDAGAASLLVKVRDDLNLAESQFDEDMSAARLLGQKGDWKGFDDKISEARVFASRPDDDDKIAALEKEMAPLRDKR